MKEQHSSHLRKIGACLPASTLKPEEREIGVDSGASMHMTSKKDLNSAELETVTTSRSPTTVITASGEVQTHEEATGYVKELDIFLTMKVLEDTQAVLSLGKLCDEHGYSYEWINGPKPHLFKNGIRIQCKNGKLRTNRGSWFIYNFLKVAFFNTHDSFRSGNWSFKSPPATVSSESVDRQVRWDPYASETSEELLNKPTKIPKPNNNVNHEQVRRDPYYSDIHEWLQEFRENLVDERVPEHRDSHASSSHEPSLEPMRSVDLGKHSFYSHFPKDRNCEICQRTKITRAPCRRRIGRVVHSAEKFGDLITADHKVPSEGCESRNNHRYAVVVQDLATQWIRSYPCKTNTSQETERSFQKFFQPDRKPEVIYSDNSLEFGKACEDLSWDHCTSTPYRSETNGIAERAVRWVNEGTSAVLLQSGLDGKWCRFHGMLYLSAEHSRSLFWWEDSIWKTLWRSI